ncbi:glycosyltransferase family 4 protein [Sphingoaurantiacus capsulatus]|uniref:Glycosyltransferase family 4 protein n=1 Tax=Sphingoaurantiacus capsulatus TaxID=1771310 RepID=A0ABV7XCE9_9SPHN
MAWIALAAALALVISGLVGANAMRLGKAIGVLDFPDTAGGRKQHAKITPLVGGLGIVLSVVAVVLAVLADPTTVAAVRIHLAWFAFAVASMFLIGLADDRFALGPKIRLALAFIVLLLVVLYAPDFGLPFLRFSISDRTWFLDDAGQGFALLCLVGLLNAVNMADGKNGLVTGICLVWSLTLLPHCPGPLLPVLAATTVALAVTMAFNLKGKLFLGDGGSYALSGVFGLFAIYTYNHEFAAIRADHIAVLFAIPVFDTIRLMSVRIRRGVSPFLGDRDHLHHHLALRWGWPRRGLFIYLAMVAGPNALTLLWPQLSLAWLALALAAYTVVISHAARTTRA